MELLKRFEADQKGGVAILFGLALLPLVGFAGAAIDYSRATMVHTKMQTAVDMASLAIVKLPQNASQAEMDKIAVDSVKSMFGGAIGARGTSGVLLANPRVTRDGKTVKVEANGSIDMLLMNVLGQGPVQVGAKSTAVWSSKKIEIALVLDNTGSMGDTVGGRRKMDELIAGANRFVTKARDRAIEADSIRIAIVPFDTQVRVSTGSVAGQSWYGFSGSVTAANWKGYVNDRSGAFAGTDTVPAGSTGLYPAAESDNSRTDLPTIQPLTSAMTGTSEMTSKISAMKPRGNTNIALGVTWGLATLSPGLPYTETSSDPNVERHLIVFTDGVNTSYRKDGRQRTVANPNNPSPTDPILIELNAYTTSACTEAKKIAKIHTIRLLAGDENLLRSCATTPGNYQNVTQPTDLTEAFEKVLGDILGTRLSS